MKNKMLSLLTAFAAAVLLLNTAAVPGSALDEYISPGILEVEFTSELVLNADAIIPDVVFEYTISPGTPEEPTETTIGIFAGAAGAEAGSAVFTDSDEGVIGTDGKNRVTKTVKIIFPEGSFTIPGIYRYVLTQTNPNIAGLTVDTHHTRYIDIFVTDNNPNLKISSWEIKNAAETGIPLNEEDEIGSVTKSDRYVNTITQSNFTFSKTISGNQGDKNKHFLFKIELDKALPGTYLIDFNNTSVYSSEGDTLIDPEESSQTIAVGVDGKSLPLYYRLAEGSVVTVKNLNVGAKVTVTEDSEDYTPSWVLSAGGTGSGSSASGIWTMTAADKRVDFTNERHGIVPSGLFDISFVPYLIPIVIIIIVYVVVMIKKRKNNDDDDDDDE